MRNPFKLPRNKAVVGGVYFLFKDDNIIYVGQSSNIAARIGRHSNFEEYAYIECFSKKERLALELEYQTRLNLVDGLHRDRAKTLDVENTLASILKY